MYHSRQTQTFVLDLNENINKTTLSVAQAVYILLITISFTPLAVQLPGWLVGWLVGEHVYVFSRNGNLTKLCVEHLQ